MEMCDGGIVEGQCFESDGVVVADHDVGASH